MQNIIFFGSDSYSALVLSRLIETSLSTKKFQLLAVVTDRPKLTARDQSLGPNPVEQLAITHKLKVSYYPSNPGEMNNFIDILTNQISDNNTFGLCASFDHLLPQSVIELFGDNLYNLHPSLLPQYRNVSPVQYAIALGDKVTGITLFRISTGIDNGTIVGQSSELIRDDDSTPTLTPRLFEQGAQLFIDFLKNPSQSAQEHPTTQENKKLIFTHRLTRDSGHIEWAVLANLLKNHLPLSIDTKNELLQLRLAHNPGGNILSDLLAALSPWPGIWSMVPSKKGELRISLVSCSGSLIPNILIAGKHKAISLVDFMNNYL